MTDIKVCFRKFIETTVKSSAPKTVAFVYLYRTMRVIAVKTIKLYARKKKEAEQSLFAWYHEACKAGWKNHNELKEQIHNASVAGDKRVIFNIHGNKYRLIVDIEYRLQIIFIVWVGTHKEYDKIDVKTVAYVKTN